jgi:hypothetical protein
VSDDFEDARAGGPPLPADFEQAIEEVLALRKLLKHERERWVKAELQREKFRRELSSMASSKDKEINTLKDRLASSIFTRYESKEEVK